MKKNKDLQLPLPTKKGDISAIIRNLALAADKGGDSRIAGLFYNLQINSQRALQVLKKMESMGVHSSPILLKQYNDYINTYHKINLDILAAYVKSSGELMQSGDVDMKEAINSVVINGNEILLK